MRKLSIKFVLLVILGLAILPGCNKNNNYDDQGSAVPGDNSTITTIAGNGARGYSGDNGPAVNAGLYSPENLAIDGFDNIYIADTGNNRIRKIDGSDNISTVTGNGTGDYDGDGGAAIEAEINSPHDVTVYSGNIYIADYQNACIRMVNSSSGKISTIAGIGSQAGFDNDGNSAVTAKLNYPSGVAVDGSGNIYIADTVNHRIRKINVSGDISTVAGNGTAGYSGDDGPAVNAELNYPVDIAVDNAGNLYIADNKNNRIRKVDISSQNISTIAGTGKSDFAGDGGVATDAALNSPRGIAVDSAGNIYIADTNNHRIRKVDSVSGYISTIAGNGNLGFRGDNGHATGARLSYPAGVAVDASGNLYIADTGNHRIRKVTFH
jgi:Gluconolactonase